MRPRSKTEMPLEVGIPVQVSTLQLTLAGPTKLKLKGKLAIVDDAKKAELRRQFSELHEGVVRLRRDEFEIDVAQVDFVNSSSIRVFIDWIALAKKAEYKLVFLTDPAVTWQRLTFQVLGKMAPKTVVVAQSPMSGRIKIAGR